MITFKAAVASCPRQSGEHNSDNFYFNSKFITEDLMRSQVMLAHKKGQDGIQMYAVTDGSAATAYKDEISLMLVRGLKKFHARLIDDPDLDPVKVIDEYNRDAYSAAKRRSMANENRPSSSLALMYINGDSLVFSNTGNVRIYRIRKGVVELFSVDHTQAQKMVDLGLMTADKALVHPQRKKLTQFFGVMPEEVSFKPVVFEENAKAGDVYVLCSSGCYENVSMARMAEISEEFDAVSDLTKAIFAEATSMGCRDDITVLAVKAENPNVVPPVVNKNNINASAHVGATVGAGVGVAMAGAGTAAKAGGAAAGKVAKNSKPVSNAERKTQSANAKKSGTVLGSIKSLFGIGSSEDGEENTQIWPALIVFAICLILVIVLTWYGIKIYNQNNKEQEPVRNNYNPYGTVAPTDEITPVPTDPSGDNGTEDPIVTDGTATNAPTNTGAPTTSAPTTNAPSTNAPSTSAPSTSAPATSAPTEAPSTDAPATDAPATDAPATDAPATDVPTTDVPATDAPTSDPTDVPTSEPVEVPSGEPVQPTDAQSEE